MCGYEHAGGIIPPTFSHVTMLKRTLGRTSKYVSTHVERTVLCFIKSSRTCGHYSSQDRKRPDIAI